MLLLVAYGDGPYLGKSVELESWTLGVRLISSMGDAL